MDMITENKVVPKLRFREFNDYWNNYLLGNIAEFLKGKGISKSELDDDGKTECIRYGELYVYYNELIDQIHELNLSSQVIFAAHKVLDHKDLSDVYAHGRACTYFSTYEGFGNAFVECVLAKKPIFVNNYKPVYMQDIGNKGFETVMTEDGILTNQNVQQMSDIIYNPKRCLEIGEHNFNLGKKYFSFDVLEEKLNNLFTF